MDSTRDSSSDDAGRYAGLFADWLGELPEAVVESIRDLVENPPPDEVILSDRRFDREEVLEILDRQWELFSATPGLPYHLSDTAAVGIAGSWWATVHRQTRAAVVLVRAGQGTEAAPNLRSALEHAVTLELLAQAHEAGEVGRLLTELDAKQAKDAGTLINDLEQLSTLSDAERHALKGVRDIWSRPGTPERDNSLAYLSIVKQATAKLPAGDLLYLYYRQFSSQTHAGFASAMPYLKRLIDDGRLAKAPVPFNLAEPLGLMVWACATSSLAMDRFLAERVLEPRVRPLLEGLGLEGVLAR